MMTKRIFSALLAAALSLSLLAGCGSTSGSTASSAADGPQRYSTVFYDVFDTVTQVIAYCDSEEEFTMPSVPSTAPAATTRADTSRYIHVFCFLRTVFIKWTPRMPKSSVQMTFWCTG